MYGLPVLTGVPLVIMGISQIRVQRDGARQESPAGQLAALLLRAAVRAVLPLLRVLIRVLQVRLVIAVRVLQVRQ